MRACLRVCVCVCVCKYVHVCFSVFCCCFLPVLLDFVCFIKLFLFVCLLLSSSFFLSLSYFFFFFFFYSQSMAENVHARARACVCVSYYINKVKFRLSPKHIFPSQPLSFFFFLFSFFSPLFSPKECQMTTPRHLGDRSFETSCNS